MLAGLADVVDQATTALTAFDHTKALEVSETFFWTFCDDYLELVKDRAYGAGDATVSPETLSARTGLALALDTLLRLFAPVLPFATEEVWSWWREGSVHVAPWPVSEPLRAAAVGATLSELTMPGYALGALRKIKSEAKVSMRTPIILAELAVPPAAIAAITADGDLRNAGRVTGDLVLVPAVDGQGDSHTQGGIVVVRSELGEAPAKTPR